MKTVSRFKFIYLVAGLMVLAVSVQAGPFYVVVGTFAKEHVARKFATNLRHEYAEAAFTLDHGKNVFHVHVMETNRFAFASAFRDNIQKSGFANAWIFTDFQSETSASYVDAGSSAIELQLYTGNTVLLSSADNSILSISKTAPLKKNDAEENNATEKVGRDLPLAFVARTLTGQDVMGKVVMLKHGKELSSFKTNEVVSLGGTQRDNVFTFICQVQGFSPEVRVINLAEVGTLPDVYQNDDGVWAIRFHVVRAKVDEIPLLYHELFYQDASVFQEESRDVVELIANVMKNNPAWKIVIDSHCNSLSGGKMFVPGREKQYFEIGQSVEKSGSAKLLSKSRGESFRECLAARGVDKGRITVMGWGDLDPLVKGAEADVSVNDRVEIRLVSGE
jgi:hypothetical protein